jgi:hypothetical protein
MILSGLVTPWIGVTNSIEKWTASKAICPIGRGEHFGAHNPPLLETTGDSFKQIGDLWIALKL